MDGEFRWDDLRFFLAVWRKGSFSAAAKALSVEQSTVSRRIAALEQALGGPLFDRTARGPVGTDLGRQLLPWAERTEHATEQAREVGMAASGEVEGTVRLAAVESFAVQLLIPELLGDLCGRHPKLRLGLVTSERTAELAHREADLALRFYRPTEGDLVTKRVAVLPRVILGQREYVLSRPAEATALDWVVLDLGERMGDDERYVAEHVGVPPRLRVTGHLAQVASVQAGLGVAVLASTLQRWAPELMEVPLDLPTPPPVELWLVTPRSLRHVPRVAAVWEFLEQRLTGLGAEQGGPL